METPRAVPELRQLRAFVAVAEELNFTRAAERLHLGQQAVSKSVRGLERELGVDLLERTTHDVRLTQAGTVLLEAGRDALIATDAAFGKAQSVGRGVEGTVRVGLSPAVGPAVREAVNRAIRDGSPRVAVSFHEVRPAEIAPRLRDRTLDLVIARTAAPARAVQRTDLRPSAAELLVPAGHRLSDRSSVRLAEVDGERLLTWNPRGTPYTDVVVGLLEVAGARVEPVQAQVTGGSDAPDLAEADAVALVPTGWPVGAGNVRLRVEDDVTLPLVLLSMTGTASPVVRRIASRLSPAG
jgi:DNA-binding transcriptional LysR family regulator